MAPELEAKSLLLFVYGSLKRGQSNCEQLRSAEFVAEARTAPRFALRVVDGYPVLVPGTRSIAGELYRIAPRALPALDEFEGQGYARREIELANAGRALAYLATVADAGNPHPADEWPSPARPR